MSTSNVTIRMDDQLKRSVEGLFDEMGLNMTTAFTIFAKTVVRERRIPFEIKVDPFFSETNMARLRSAAHDMEAGTRSATHELAEDAHA